MALHRHQTHNMTRPGHLRDGITRRASGNRDLCINVRMSDGEQKTRERTWYRLCGWSLNT
jgi:hypothetical protein